MTESSTYARALAAVETVKLDVLKPYPNNARTHSRKQIKKIAASLKHFGFINPILIDQNNQIIAGHGRVAAARLLGLTEAPALRIEHLTESDKRAYILADNRLAEDAGWDKEILAIELQSLIEFDVGIEIAGFDIAEVDLLLTNEADKQAPDPDRADEVPPLSVHAGAVTRRGDLWQLGNHLLLCGDGTQAASYERLLGDEKAAMIFTDPPYNVPIQGNTTGFGKTQYREFAMAAGEMTPADFERFLRDAFTLLAAHSRDGAIHFICMDWRHMREILAAGGECYSELKNLCVWVKSNGGQGSFYRSRHELIFAFKSGSAPHINNFELGQTGRYRTNVWEFAGVNAFGRDRGQDLAMHPTVKPVALVAEALKDCSKRKQIVLDPFGGSGSTLIAAEKTGRRARIVEIDPLYCDVIIRRWQALTGKHAERVDTRHTFEEIEERQVSDVAPHPRHASPQGLDTHE